MKSFPDFATFFQEVWRREPFPWQNRLAAQVATQSWPEWVTLPTGTGKTAAIDIAIYSLARQSACPEQPRTAPVRIVFAVNRRIVVDEAFERAKAIATRLQEATEAPGDPLQPVARALQLLSGMEGGKPLETYPLRGATFTDHSWARTPLQPLVITTTLDQLGSRLLFRGYGVSTYARPLHAALLANDALLILDEAHTSKAFSQTLSAIARLRKAAAEPLDLPFATVQLTATPPPDVGDPFRLDDADRANPVIAARLGAPKPTELVAVLGARGANRHKQLAEEIAERARALCLAPEGPRRILAVVNRVATAEALWEELTKPQRNRGLNAAVHLLTGRLRPLDRDERIAELNSRHQLKASDPAPDVPKLILVATQCIEVGADFDFDAILIELAPLDSLRQRFGRLNRQGRKIPAPAFIFAPEEAVAPESSDLIYGECLPAVWQWLVSAARNPGGLCLGLDSQSRIIPDGEALGSLLAPTTDAPILLEPHLDLLCQTSPEPHVVPDPALYIHGPGRDFPEVSVVFRADFSTLDNPQPFLDSVPPLATEAATIPLYHARNWLEYPGKAADSGGDTPERVDTWRNNGKIRLESAFRWTPDGSVPLSDPRDLLAGDVLVLPAQTPPELLSNLLPISNPDAWWIDQFERAHLLSRDRLAIRFHVGVRNQLERRFPDEPALAVFRELTARLFARDEEEGRWVFRESVWLEAMPTLAALVAECLPADHPLLSVWRHAAYLADGLPRPASDWRVVPYPPDTIDGVLLMNRSRVGATPWPFDPEELGRQGSGASERVGLARHSEAVGKRAFRNSAALPEPLATTVRDAGSWHDRGKLDPRFQAFLHGCSPWMAGSKDAVAKSGRPSSALDQHYRKLADLPEGFRHELLSALIVAQSAACSQHPQRDLLLHLIASHHGRCRAMAPVVHDPRPEPFEVDCNGERLRFDGQDCPLAHLSSGVARRFWTLTRRFGWWGLAYLESLLRLADQFESANPTGKP